MARISKLTQNSTTVYPQTITTAIADISRKKTLPDVLTDIETNISNVYTKSEADARTSEISQIYTTACWGSDDNNYNTTCIVINENVINVGVMSTITLKVGDSTDISSTPVYMVLNDDTHGEFAKSTNTIVQSNNIGEYVTFTFESVSLPSWFRILFVDASGNNQAFRIRCVANMPVNIKMWYWSDSTDTVCPVIGVNVTSGITSDSIRDVSHGKSVADVISTIENKNYVNTLGGASGDITFENSTLPGGISFNVSNKKLSASTILPIQGIVANDKVLNVSNYQLSSTLGLEYTQKTGDTAKKIYLTGKDGATIASIDTTDFTKDKFIQSAELVKTAEPGITIEVPYIKITFNDTTDPIRFSVKDLMDTYDGSNLKLSSKYSSTTGVTPANGVVLDAAIQNINTRIGTTESALGNVLNSVSSGTTSGYVTLSVGTKVNKNQSISVSAPTITVGTDIVNATSGTDKLVSAVGVKDYVSSNYPNNGDFNKVTAVVSANTTNIANALNSVSGAQSTDGFVSITASTKSNKSQTLTPSIKSTNSGTTLSNATLSNDYIPTATAVKEYSSYFCKSWVGTSTEYSALSTFDENTIYYIVE